MVPTVRDVDASGHAHAGQGEDVQEGVVELEEALLLEGPQPEQLKQ